MGNFDYSFVFCDSNGKPLGTPVDTLLSKKLRRARGVPREAEVSLSLTSPLYEFMAPGSTRLKVYRAPSDDERKVNVNALRQLVFYGDCPPENWTDDTDGTGSLTMVFVDPRWRLRRRWTDDGFFTGVPVEGDQGDLLWSLVANANVYDPTFLRQGNTVTGVQRERTWEPKSIQDLIEDMAGVIGGPDVDVEPWDGWTASGSRDMGFLHVYASQGQDRPKASFLYGKGLATNLAGATRKFLPVTNRARVTGVSSDGGTLVRGYAELPNYTYIGMLEDVWTEQSVSEQLTLQVKAENRVNTDSQLREVLVLNGPTSKAPRPYEHFDVGDTCRATVRKGGLQVTDRKVRVDTYELDLSGALPVLSVDVESTGVAAPDQIGVAAVTPPPVVPPPPPGSAPAVATVVATGVTTSGGTLQADVIPGDADADVVFAYGPTPAYGSTVDKGVLPASTGTTRVTHALSGLAQGQTVHYEGRATSANSPDGNPSRGGDQAFTTGVVIPLPTVSTRSTDNIASDQARLRGNVNPNVLVDTSWWLELSATPFADGAPAPVGARATVTQTIAGGGTTNVQTAVTMGGLNPGTLYYVRQVAQGPGGIAYATAVQFVTSNVGIPADQDPNDPTNWNPGLFTTWDGKFLGLGLYGVGTRPRTLVVYQGDVITGPGYAAAIRPYKKDQASAAIPPQCITSLSVPWSASPVPCLQDIDIRGKVIGTNNPQNNANGGNPSDLNNDTFFDMAMRNVVVRNAAYSDTDPFKMFSCVNWTDDSGYVALRGCRYDIDQFELAYGPGGLSELNTTRKNTDGTYDTSRTFPWWRIKPASLTTGGTWTMTIAWKDWQGTAYNTALTGLAHDIHPDDLQDQIAAAMKADAPGTSGGNVFFDGGTRVTGARRRDGTVGVVRTGSWVGVTGFPAAMYKQSYNARYALTFGAYNNAGPSGGTSLAYGSQAIIPAGTNKTTRGVKITSITLTSSMTGASGAVAFQSNTPAAERSKFGYDDAMVLSKSAGIMQRFYNHHFCGDAAQRGPQFVQATAVARGTQVDKYGTHWMNPERSINFAGSNDHMDQCQFFTWDGSKNCLAHTDAVTGALVTAQANYWSEFAVYHKVGGQSCVFADGTDRQDTSAGVATPKPKRHTSYRCLFSGPNKGYYMENAVECGPVDCRFASTEDPDTPGKGVFSAANAILNGFSNTDLIAWQNKLDTGAALTRSGAVWLNGTGGPP